MVTFNPKTLAALTLPIFALTALAAPAPAPQPHILAKRSLLWPGRLFGDDRWGVVVGPPADQVVLSEPTSGESANKSESSPNPLAANPAALPAPIPASSTALASATPDIIKPVVPTKSATANGFKALKPTTTRSTTSASTSTTSPKPTSTVRPSSSSKSTTRSSFSSIRSSTARSTSTTPRPSSTPTSPRPFSTTTVRSPVSTSIVQPKPAPSSSEAPAPKPTTTKVTTSPKPKPTSTTTKNTLKPAPTSAPQPAPTSTSNHTTSAADIAAYLKGHNDERAKHGAAALTFSEALAAKAQQWANNCQFKHSGGSLGPFGENLAAGTGDFSIAAGLKAWNDEAPDYDPANPEASHWTQVVWKSSTQVGCAVQRCNGIFADAANFYVCEYSPAGNFIGRFPENVQK